MNKHIKHSGVRKLLVILLMTFSICPLVKAQGTGNYDSLFQVWLDKSNDSRVRMKALRTYVSSSHLANNADTIVYFGYRMLDLAEKEKDSLFMSIAYNLIGLGSFTKSDFPDALKYYRKSINIKEALGNEHELAISYGNLANLYARNGFHQESLIYLKKVLKMSRATGDSIALIQSYNSLGVSFYYMDSMEISSSYFDSVQIMLDDGFIDNRDMRFFRCFVLGNKGEIHLNLGEMDKAYREIFGALLCMKDIENQKMNLYLGYTTMGKWHNEKGNYDSAVYYCSKSSDFYREREVESDELDACRCLWRAYRGLGEYEKSTATAARMFSLDSNLEEAGTNVKLRQEYFRVSLLEDSLNRVEEKRQLEAAHQSEIQENEKKRNLAFILGAIGLIVALGFYLRWRLVHKANRVITKERQRSDNLLLNILPAEIAEELKEKGEATARSFEEVSIIFTDFKDFTKLSAKLSPDELVRKVNIFFKEFDHICERYGIEKIKTIGDSYMAVSGLPVPGEESVSKAVLASLEMMDFVRKRSAEVLKESGSPFEMRIGIHTGHVVAGIVGVKKFQYDVWGDAVNTASRMESAGQVGKVNISADTYEKIKGDDRFEFEDRGYIKIQGKGEVHTYFVRKQKRR